MVDIVEKNLRIGYVILVKLLKMKYTFYANVKNNTLRLNMFDSINGSNFVPSIDYKETFISLIASTDKCINKVIANFIHDCQIT